MTAKVHVVPYSTCADALINIENKHTWEHFISVPLMNSDTRGRHTNYIRTSYHLSKTVKSSFSWHPPIYLYIMCFLKNDESVRDYDYSWWQWKDFTWYMLFVNIRFNWIALNWIELNLRDGCCLSTSSARCIAVINAWSDDLAKNPPSKMEHCMKTEKKVWDTLTM